MPGQFTWRCFCFEATDHPPTSLPHSSIVGLCDDDFDVRLTGSGKLPDLGGAPVAPWLLTRLVHLTDNQLGFSATVEVADGGGFMVEFLVYRSPTDPAIKTAEVQPLLFDMEALGVVILPEKPIASFQLQGETEGVAVIGDCTADCPAEAVLEALAAALLAAPAELMARELAVRDPEWREDPEMYTPRPRKGARNWYGWDGSQFLGKHNIRAAE